MICSINQTFAEVRLDTITNWQFYKDNDLLFKSNIFDSYRLTATIKSNELYENLIFSIFYDFNNEKIERKIEFIHNGNVILNISDSNYSHSQFKIPKKEIDKMLPNYNEKEIFIKYIDKIYPKGLIVGTIKFTDNLYDELSTIEIKQIIKSAIDLPELQQYYHINDTSNRSPLVFKEFGAINQETLNGIKKFGKQVLVLSEKELQDNSIKEYIGIGDWSCVGNNLRLQLYYPCEGIILNYMFDKDNNEWKITNSKIIEE